MTGPTAKPGRRGDNAPAPGRPLVSICLGVRNGMRTAGAFLRGVRTQTYPRVELVVVDNFSTDGTAEFYRQHADRFFQQGPERSAQRNLAIREARGEIVLVLDGDQILSPGVVEECVTLLTRGTHGVVVPEETIAHGFWGRCKKFERDFYLAGDPSAEAARGFWRAEVLAAGGYDEGQTGSEDWDLSDRLLAAHGRFARTHARLVHDEGRLNLASLIRKKRYYAARGMSQYLRTAPAYRRVPFPLRPSVRRQWWRFLRHPVLGAGAMLMKLLEGLPALGNRRART